MRKVSPLEQRHPGFMIITLPARLLGFFSRAPLCSHTAKPWFAIGLPRRLDLLLRRSAVHCHERRARRSGSMVPQNSHYGWMALAVLRWPADCIRILPAAKSDRHPHERRLAPAKRWLNAGWDSFYPEVQDWRVERATVPGGFVCRECWQRGALHQTALCNRCGLPCEGDDHTAVLRVLQLRERNLHFRTARSAVHREDDFLLGHHPSLQIQPRASEC